MSRRPTLVETTNSCLGKPARAAPERRPSGARTAPASSGGRCRSNAHRPPTPLARSTRPPRRRSRRTPAAPIPGAVDQDLQATEHLEYARNPVAGQSGRRSRWQRSTPNRRRPFRVERPMSVTGSLVGKLGRDRQTRGRRARALAPTRDLVRRRLLALLGRGSERSRPAPGR
jgi:hypothetical protein